MSKQEEKLKADAKADVKAAQVASKAAPKKASKPGTQTFKVKILKYVGQYIPGQIILADEALAKNLCTPRKIWNGQAEELHQVAMLLSDAEKLESAQVDVSKMTAGELAKLGLKNIVHTPKDFQLKVEQQVKEHKAKLKVHKKIEAQKEGIELSDEELDAEVDAEVDDAGLLADQNQDAPVGEVEDADADAFGINPATQLPYTKAELEAIEKAKAE